MALACGEVKAAQASQQLKSAGIKTSGGVVGEPCRSTVRVRTCGRDTAVVQGIRRNLGQMHRVVVPRASTDADNALGWVVREAKDEP